MGDDVNAGIFYAGACNELSHDYTALLDGQYDCVVDRIVPNAYNPLCQSPGDFAVGGGACMAMMTNSTTPM